VAHTIAIIDRGRPVKWAPTEALLDALEASIGTGHGDLIRPTAIFLIRCAPEAE
jgi:hypothetical protein